MPMLKEGVTLYNHQKLALSLLQSNDRFALFMEQGTGKTLPTVIDMLERFQRNEVTNAIIVAPLATLAAWERTKDLLDDEARKLFETSDITIINYDKVWRGDYEKVYDLIILDESHAIKNRGSKRSKWALRTSPNAKVTRILTGTPIGNGQLENIWSQFAFLKPSKYRQWTRSEDFGSWSKFCENYCYLNKWWQPYRYKNVDRLQEIIDQNSYRVKKEDCLDLPDKLPDETYSIELKPKKIYREMKKDKVMEELGLIAENPLTHSLYLREIATGFIKDEQGNVHSLGSNKPKELKTFLEDFNKKLVIFFQFKESKRQILEVLKAQKIKHVVLDGETKDKTVWKSFQTQEDVKVIVCQYQSANQGIDLYAADTILYYEPTNSSTIMEQSRDRIHRIGQNHPCSYICFETKGTIEPYIYKALRNYEDFNERLFTEYIEEYQRSYGG